MGSNIGAVAGGIAIGMFVLLMCEPLYEKLTEVKKDITEGMMKAKTCTEKSLVNMMENVNFDTDNALDIVNNRIDDIIKFINDLDVSKLKGKSRMALIAMKQKINELKQN